MGKITIIIGLLLFVGGIILGLWAILYPIGDTYSGKLTFDFLSDYYSFADKVNSLPKVESYDNDITVISMERPEHIVVRYEVYVPHNYQWDIESDSRGNALDSKSVGFLMVFLGIPILIAGCIKQ